VKPEAVLAAGGFVATDAKVVDAVDVVVARAYEHPVLPGRTVVRLTAQTVVAGDDLEMATLGFGEGEDRGAVAKERRRPLGFPGWALVHDPNNARFALDVVKEFKKHARRAKSKPGFAKDGLDKLALALGKTVPHFLPSFYEEAGRAFLEHGSPTFAAAMFGKARAAEAVHALNVDEQHRIDAFLEFALAGAVTTKALADYAKDLGEHHKPVDAYAHFRQLCVQRTLGGMPPWGGMAKDLARLAKAAKLDPDAEDAKLVEDIIESPALAKASTEFWRAYGDPIVALARAKPEARTALLNLFPSCDDDVWLDLVEQSGGIVALAEGSGVATWFDKLTQHMARSWRDSQISNRAFTLLRTLAPALIKEGKPITCCGRWNALDLDLAELALELGVSVELPPNVRLDLAAWAKHASEPEHGRDPVKLAAHGPLLGTVIGGTIGEPLFDQVTRGKAGFLAAKRAWLEAAISSGERGGLPDLEALLQLVHDRVRPSTFAELPDLQARFVALDVAPALARTLQIGIVDEFGWIALEQAVAELDPAPTGAVVKPALRFHGGLPALVVTSSTRAIAVGAQGRLGVHDLVLPPKTELLSIRFIGGQFLVTLKEGHKPRGYWSSAPHELFDLEGSVWNVAPLAPRAVVLADGAWLEGKRAIRVGDRTNFDGGLMNYDGTTAWLREWKDGRTVLREASPSGELGRASWPSFLEPEDDWQIDGAESFVLPLPSGGLYGIRVRTRATAARELNTLDGLAWTSEPGALAVNRLVRLPSGETRPVLETTEWRGGTFIAICDATGRIRGSTVNTNDRRYASGSPTILPLTMWPAFTVRDVVGSKWLRSVTDVDARTMLAALPAIENERLGKGVAGIVEIARLAQGKHGSLVDRSASPATFETSTVTDEALVEAVGGWTERKWGSQSGTFAQIARVTAWFASDDRSDRVVSEELHAQLSWLRFALYPNALAFLAVARGAKTEPLLALTRAIAKLPDPAKLRFYDGARVTSPTSQNVAFDLVWHKGNAFALVRQSWGADYRVLQYAPDGNFITLPGFNTGRPEAGQLALRDLAAVEAAVAAKQTSWRDPAALAQLTGMTESEAAFLWVGMPNAHDSSANFLDKQLRESIDLKATQAALARDLLKSVPLGKRLTAIADVGLDALLEDGPTRLAAAWNERVGKRLAIPEQLISDADREVQAPFEPGVALVMIGNAESSARLTTEGFWAIDERANRIAASSATPLVQRAVEGDREVFDERALGTVLAYLPFIYADLAVGEPLRTQAAIAFDLVQLRLKSPSLMFELGTDSSLEPAGVEAMLASIGGEDITGLAEGFIGRDAGGVIVTRNQWMYGAPPKTAVRSQMFIRPGRLDGKELPFAKLFQQWGWSGMAGLALVRNPDVQAIAARIRETPVPDGGWEQNPQLAIPKLVTRVAKKAAISADAAALYLQYLVQLSPTPKNLLLWNAWKPKQLDAANAELVKGKLILEAKRERAKRPYFLPGAWEAMKSPHVPFESWKLPFYGTRVPEGGVTPTGPHRFIALAPFHVLYERAWQRIESGDIPKYDEVKR
jgi:hypothetical protein